jgi:hypothetical protein
MKNGLPGLQRWTYDKYSKKLTNLARVLAEIGSAENPDAPTFIMVAK